MTETRRSFLVKLSSLMLAGEVPLASEAAQKKSPSHLKKSSDIERGSLKKKARLITPQQNAQPHPKEITNNTKNDTEQLAQLYMPLCEQLEGNIPFAYQNSDNPTFASGVCFQGFLSELGNKPAIKITPKKNCTLDLDKGMLEKFSIVYSNNPKTWNSPKMWTTDRDKNFLSNFLSKVEKIEQVTLNDCKGSFPNSKATQWGNTLFLAPPATLKDANRYAVNFYIQKAKEMHPNLFKLPPSVQLVVLDLVYNLGDTRYSNEFVKFQEAVKANDYTAMKKQCTTLNTERRNAVRKWLIESARLTNKGLSEAKITQNLQSSATSGMYPRQEPLLWRAINEGTKANCTKRAKNILTKKMCLTQSTGKKS